MGPWESAQRNKWLASAKHQRRRNSSIGINYDLNGCSTSLSGSSGVISITLSLADSYNDATTELNGWAVSHGQMGERGNRNGRKKEIPQQQPPRLDKFCADKNANSELTQW